MKIQLRVLEIIYGIILTLGISTLIAEYFFIDQFKVELKYMIFAVPVLTIGISLSFSGWYRIIFLVAVGLISMLTVFNGSILLIELWG